MSFGVLILKTLDTMKGPFWGMNRSNLFSAPALQLAAIRQVVGKSGAPPVGMGGGVGSAGERVG